MISLYTRHRWFLAPGVPFCHISPTDKISLKFEVYPFREQLQDDSGVREPMFTLWLSSV